MAKLHKAFLICEQEITCWDNSLLDEMNSWICKSLKENNFKYISESDFEKDLEELKNCYSELPKQLIHRDMHYGNILFNEDKFSGYIDFDLSQKNIRLFDLCYFLNEKNEVLAEDGLAYTTLLEKMKKKFILQYAIAW